MTTERIPDPGLPRADGYYLQLSRAALHAQGIRSMEEFSERYGVDVLALSAFGLLWTVDRQQAERELHLNALYRAARRVIAHPQEEAAA